MRCISPLNSFASGFAQHSCLIQAFNNAFFRLNCLFLFRQLQNTHYLSDSKHFTLFEAQNIDTTVFFYLSERKKCFPHFEYRDFDFSNSFFCKKKASAEYSEKNTFFLEPRRIKNPFSRKMFLLHIFLCSFALIPINKNTSILRKFKKAISKFKKNRNNNIFYEKSKFYLSKLIFTICNYIFILYLCYYLFFLFSLETFEYSARIKSLFRQKLFLKRSKKSSRLVVCHTSSHKQGPFFVFLLKKNSSKSVLSLRIPMCRKINK